METQDYFWNTLKENPQVSATNAVVLLLRDETKNEFQKLRAEMNQQFISVRTELMVLKQDVSALNQKVDRLEHKVDKIEQRLEFVAEHVAKIYEKMK